MKIRDLKAADLWKLSEIAEKVSADLVESFSDEEINEKKTGIQMVLAILRYFPDEIREFLAFVTDQTPEELDEKGFTEPLKIIKELYKKKEFKDFLQEVKSITDEVLKARST
jgi:intein-encoded DNA endonuclease-like protein